MGRRYEKRSRRPRNLGDEPGHENLRELEERLEQERRDLLKILAHEDPIDQLLAFERSHATWESYFLAEVEAIYPSTEKLDLLATMGRDKLKAELIHQRLVQMRRSWN